MTQRKKSSVRGKSPADRAAVAVSSGSTDTVVDDGCATGCGLWEACCGYCALEFAGVWMCLSPGLREQTLWCQALHFCVLWRASYYVPEGLSIHVQLRAALMVCLATQHAWCQARQRTFDWPWTDLTTNASESCRDPGLSLRESKHCELDAERAASEMAGQSSLWWLAASLVAAVSACVLMLVARKRFL
jgi:hypothetical protein